MASAELPERPSMVENVGAIARITSAHLRPRKPPPDLTVFEDSGRPDSSGDPALQSLDGAEAAGVLTRRDDAG